MNFDKTPVILDPDDSFSFISIVDRSSNERVRELNSVSSLSVITVFYKGRDMKKNDVFLILFCLLIAAVAWFWFNFGQKTMTEGIAVIYKNGDVHTTLSLSSDEIITIEDEEGRINIIGIKDGKADMIDANCNDKICVHTRSAHKNGQSIVCLPNRVVVEIKSDEKDEIDGVSE